MLPIQQIIVTSALVLAGTVHAETNLTLKPATVVEIQAEAGILYQVEKSTDLDVWEPVGPFVIGEGDKKEVIIPRASDSVFFRLAENPIADLSSELETLRLSSGVPGLAAAVFQDGKLTGIGVTGQRRAGVDSPVQFTDKWHNGSITKSMTATLAAVLVEEGSINWTTTLGDVFPEKSASMATGWSAVTLKQLLANSGGAPGDLNTSGIWTKLWNFKGSPVDGRELLLDEVTALPLRYTPGQGYEYSNAGFALAGAMLETVSDTQWEHLITEKLFKPLGMSRTAFGPPATPRQLDNPVGHSGTVGNPTVWDPGESADNPTAIAPAATVHSSISDIARYVEFHLLEGSKAGSLLSPASFEQLHTRAFGNDYALGWSIFNRTWAGGDAITHTGSNTQWYTTIWIAPEVNWACVIDTNFGGTDAFAKNDQVVAYLLNNYAP